MLALIDQSKGIEINVHDIVTENIDLFKSVAGQKRIALVNDVAADLMLKVDLNSMNTIIRNLLDNALKYTANGGAIKIIAS